MAVTGGVVFVSGVALTYLAALPRFKTRLPEAANRPVLQMGVLG